MESVIGNFVDNYILQDLNAEKTLKLKRQSHVTGINTNMHAYSLGKENYRQIILIIVVTKFICFNRFHFCVNLYCNRSQMACEEPKSTALP